MVWQALYGSQDFTVWALIKKWLITVGERSETTLYLTPRRASVFFLSKVRLDDASFFCGEFGGISGRLLTKFWTNISVSMPSMS